MISDLVSLPCLFLPFSKKKDEKGWRDIIVFRRKTMVGSKGSNHGSISLLTCPAVFVRDPTIVRSPFGRSNHEPFILLLLIKDENKILYNIRDKSKCIKRRIFFLFLEGYIRKGKSVWPCSSACQSQQSQKTTSSSRTVCKLVTMHSTHNNDDSNSNNDDNAVMRLQCMTWVMNSNNVNMTCVIIR